MTSITVMSTATKIENALGQLSDEYLLNHDHLLFISMINQLLLFVKVAAGSMHDLETENRKLNKELSLLKCS